MSDAVPVVAPGTRLTSVVCTTEVVVVRPSAAGAVLECGGWPMRAAGADAARPESALSALAGYDGGSLIGKRSTSADGSLEVLCVKAGGGALSIDGELLQLRTAKPLPSSD